MKQLNKEQQKLVEYNHNLIWSFMNKNKLSTNAVEDWYGTCAIGLCKAAIAYNPDKNLKFSTLAYVCMHNEVKKVLENISEEINCLSLEYNVNENIKLADCIRSSHDELGEIEFYEVFYKYYDKLSDRNKQIIDDYIHKDINFAEIAGNVLIVTDADGHRIVMDFNGNNQQRLFLSNEQNFV